jgi:hypothetical protein
MRIVDRHACLDCTVIPGECVVPPHKLVVADFRFRACLQRSKCVQMPRTKWWKLKEEAANVKLKRHGALDVCTWIGVWIT